MIRLEGLSIMKKPLEYDHDGKVKTWQWCVVSTAEHIAGCDTQDDAETLIGSVRLRVAVHNNTRGRTNK